MVIPSGRYTHIFFLRILTFHLAQQVTTIDRRRNASLATRKPVCLCLVAWPICSDNLRKLSLDINQNHIRGKVREAFQDTASHHANKSR